MICSSYVGVSGISGCAVIKPGRAFRRQSIGGMKKQTLNIPILFQEKLRALASCYSVTCQPDDFPYAVGLPGQAGVCTTHKLCWPVRRETATKTSALKSRLVL